MHHFRTSVEFYFIYRLNFYAVILWNIPQKFFLSFCSDETFLFCFFEDGQKKEMLVAGLTFFFPHLSIFRADFFPCKISQLNLNSYSYLKLFLRGALYIVSLARGQF